MKINSENKQGIHDVLITDMQKRLYNMKVFHVFINDNQYQSHLESLVDSIIHTNSIADINDVIIEYGDIFDISKLYNLDDNIENIFTLDGTLNYVLSLLVSEIDKLEQAYEFNQIHN